MWAHSLFPCHSATFAHTKNLKNLFTPENNNTLLLWEYFDWVKGGDKLLDAFAYILVGKKLTADC